MRNTNLDNFFSAPAQGKHYINKNFCACLLNILSV